MLSLSHESTTKRSRESQIHARRNGVVKGNSIPYFFPREAAGVLEGIPACAPEFVFVLVDVLANYRLSNLFFRMLRCRRNTHGHL